MINTFKHLQTFEQHSNSSDIEKAIERFSLVESELTTLNTQIREYYEPLFTEAGERKDQAEFDRLISELPTHYPLISVSSMASRYGLKLNSVQHTNTSNIRKEIELFNILYEERTELNKQIREYYEPLFTGAGERNDKAEFDRLASELPMNLPFRNNVYRMESRWFDED